MKFRGTPGFTPTRNRLVQKLLRLLLASDVLLVASSFGQEESRDPEDRDHSKVDSQLSSVTGQSPATIQAKVKNDMNWH